MTSKTNSRGLRRGLGFTLVRPIIVLGLLAGVTAGTFVTDVGTASASPRPTIRFQSESFDSATNTYQETVVGTGYTPGALVWIGIAVDQYVPTLGKSKWNYQWGAKVNAAPMGFFPNPGGQVRATISVPGTFGCRPDFGLSASDQATGASTAPMTLAQERKYGIIVQDQVDNTSVISEGYCIL